jgi:hypothetical protein
MTMPFTEGNSFVVTVFGKESGSCKYTLGIIDTKGTEVSASSCNVPMEKMTKDTLGHLFGQDKEAGQEAVKAAQDKLESDYCVKKSTASPSTPSPGSSSPVSPTPKKITCSGDGQGCIFTNVINNFTSGCTPTVVVTTVESGQVTFTISRSTNEACRFQMVGVGVNEDCVFAKENVTPTVIKGMLGMDNIPKDPEFIKIKAASCK